MAAALQQERVQYEEHVQQLEAHHASLQASHQKQTSLLTARLERSCQEVTDAAARLAQAEDAALDHQAKLRAANEQVESLQLALQAARDECDGLRHANRPTYASPMQSRAPLAPRMAPQPTAHQSPTDTPQPPKRASSHVDETDTPLQSGLSPLSPALFALLEGGESPRADLQTPRVLPQEDYVRLSTAVERVPLDASPACAPHRVAAASPGVDVGRKGVAAMRASVHGCLFAPRQVDERVRHWVVADDPSERTTVADPLVREGQNNK